MRIAVMALLAGLALGMGARAAEPSARLIALHDALHLSADQEGAWNDYAAALGPGPDAVARHQAADQLLPNVPTPRRIALIEAMLTQDLADFRKQGVAVKAFYGRLTPTQQDIFDRETARPASPAGTPPAR